ncbi:hypothetical protein [endosymbiont of Ridgeia piscesae]|jgi:hypothetical protein|uniref:Uncharacterized protein n=1 Tax=endosymbiont of Ridgeia piscesae TaxID=54398 RepID=A0A0T5ZBC7_9GAMM|nr:hypothetical protein [endosymbiont of Ridgeia piscesae]KRT54185.1 hypothetical protein Ga0074115_10382 [endosymbiont of Ridgeia piscesae]KRT59797.1 hypothetical protein Ga0076813_16007 [endosymbiont of Ridgeia piscesae]
MGEILTFKKRTLSDKHRGQGLCREGFHRWRTVKERQFDVKQGRLVTQFRCSRCGVTKTKAL